MKRVTAMIVACTVGCGGSAASDPGAPSGPDAADVVPVVCGEPGATHLVPLDDLAGCTTYRGSIHIGDTDEQRVPLPASLRIIEGELRFFRNDSLVDLRGVEGLAAIGGLQLSHHARLADLSALARVKITGEVFINSNSALGTLKGLEGQRELASLFVGGNGALTTLDALVALERVSGDVTIRSNSALPQSAAEAFVARIKVGGVVEVVDNKPR